MGQFKPMVKMETTEPSVILKLKKGGKVVKKADGGMMGAPMGAPPSMPARGGMPGGMPPMKPSLAMRRRAMKGLPAGAGPAGPIGGAASMQASMPPPPPPAPAMKKGGKAEGGKADMAQDKAIVKKAFKQHDMQEHKGGKGTKLSLKKGGKMATGGVVDGQGGYKAGGIINTEDQGGEYRNTKMHTAKPDRSPANTGGVKDGNGGGYATGGVAKANGGGYKKGGAPKKAYATGGTVDSGRSVAMPQGNKPVPKPVRINELAGTYKTGGKVTPAEGRLLKASAGENASSFRAAKADSNLKYGPASKMKLKEGGDVDLSKGAYDATLDEPPSGMGFAKKVHGFMDKLFGAGKEAGAGRGFVNPKSVTKSKESVTVSPMKKGGSAKC